MPFLTHNDLQVTERSVPIDRLPQVFHGFRIVQISDLHFYEYTDCAYYERVVETVTALKPDAVVVPGDVVHYGKTHIELAASFLKRIRGQEARLAFLGNQDYHDGADGANITAMMTACGYTFLRN